ncbi:MAG: hypothetical protein QXX12_02935 [Nanopusillaceae archaeon]
MKEAEQIYSRRRDPDFWNFLAKMALQIEENSDFIPSVPSFVRETIRKKVSRIKIKAILEPPHGNQIDRDKMFIPKLKLMLKEERVKYTTICLIKYISQRYNEELEKLKNNNDDIVLRIGDFSIKIQRFSDPFFDFYDHKPFYQLKSNAKTKSMLIKMLGSCKDFRSKSRWSAVSQIDAKLKIISCDTLLALLFIYKVKRKSKNYARGFSSNSNYAVAKALYVLKEPFYLIESNKRFFYDSKKHSSLENFRIKELLKEFKPQYENDKPLFKKLSSFLKKNPVSFTERIEKI